MAITQNLYEGDNSTTNYSFTFPYLKQTDIKVQLDADVTTAWSLANATTVAFDSAPGTGVKIKIYRETDTDTSPATFYAGSSIKSEDLNDNFTQNLYSNQEVNARYLSNLGGTMTGSLTMGEDAKLIFEGATDNDYETTLYVADPTADRTITLPNVTGTVITTGDTGTVTSTMIADGTVTSTDIADGTIATGDIANDAITNALIATDAVNADSIAANSVGTSELGSDAVTGAQIADDAVDSEHLAADSIDTEHYAANSVDTTALAADAVTGAQLADNAVDSEHYTDGSIDHVHLSNDCIDGDNIQDDVINSEHYAAGSIDHEHLANDIIDGDNIQDDVINSEHYAAGSIDHEHLANDIIDGDNIQDNAIGSEHIAANAVTTSEIADAELTTLASMQPATASVLAAGTDLTATLAEINTICDGKGVQTTISDTDASYPTSGAVVDYVAAQIAPIGGLEVIADEDNFPATQPAAGVVISIADAGGVVFNGSGVSTTARTVGNGSDNVTINGAPSSLYGETLAAGVGMQVSSTGSSNTYTYHKILATESDVKQLSDDINDFNSRYRINDGEPSSNNDDGDLVWDTNANKMKVYDSTASAWKEVTSSGDFKYLVLTNAGTTNAATYGSATSYDLKENSTSGSAASVTSAAQLMVSVNGVIQKANTGTSAPAEGFAMVDSDTIIFSTAPPANSSVFVIQIGSAITPTTPADNTVSTGKIQTGAVTEEKISISNGPVNGYFLQTNGSGTLTWAEAATSTDFTLTNSGTDHWVFTGGGLSSVNDPDIRVDPGQTYKFINNCSANSNPFTIQKYDGSAWVTYSDGVTNNGGQGQTTIEFTPHQDCPAILRYINTGATNMTGFLSTNDPSGGTLREMNFKTDGSGNNRGFEVVNGAVGAGGTDSRLFFGGYSNSGSTALIDADTNTLTYCAPIQYFKHTSGSSPNTFLTFNNSSTPKVEINQDWKSEGHVTFLDNKEVNVGTHNDGSLYSTGTGITLAAKTPSAGSAGHVNIVTTSGNSVLLYAAAEVIGSFGSDLATLYGTVDIQGPDSTNAGTLKIEDSNSSPNNVSITVPDDGVTGNYTITLPAAAPSANGQVLSATTAGVASWTTISGGVDSDTDKNTVAGENAGNAGTWSGAEKNTCVGYNAGTDLTSGDENIFIGNEAGANQTTGYKNVAIGSQALETSTNGFENIAIGFDALPHVSYGTQCIAIGSKAMNQATGTGTRECVAIGHDALYELTGTNYTDSYGCTAVGYMAGEDVTTTYEMGFFGRQAGKGQTMTWGELWMAHRDHNKGTASVWIHGSQGGACTQGNNSSSWTTTSDERIKKNIVDNNVGLDKINQLKVRNFEYRVQVETGTDDTGHTTWAPKTDSDIIDTSTFNTLANGEKPKPHQVAINTEGVQIGCIAQEVEAVLPGCVEIDANGVKSVDTDEMFWVMVNAIKQLSAKNDALEARIATLEAA